MDLKLFLETLSEKNEDLSALKKLLMQSTASTTDDADDEENVKKFVWSKPKKKMPPKKEITLEELQIGASLGEVLQQMYNLTLEEERVVRAKKELKEYATMHLDDMDESERIRYTNKINSTCREVYNAAAKAEYIMQRVASATALLTPGTVKTALDSCLRDAQEKNEEWHELSGRCKSYRGYQKKKDTISAVHNLERVREKTTREERDDYDDWER